MVSSLVDLIKVAPPSPQKNVTWPLFFFLLFEMTKSVVIKLFWHTKYRNERSYFSVGCKECNLSRYLIIGVNGGNIPSAAVWQVPALRMLSLPLKKMVFLIHNLISIWINSCSSCQIWEMEEIMYKDCIHYVSDS